MRNSKGNTKAGGGGWKRRGEERREEEHGEEPQHPAPSLASLRGLSVTCGKNEGEEKSLG